MMLSFEDRIEVVGYACNVDDGLLMVRESLPNAVLMNMDLPCKSGLSMLKQFRRKCPDVRLLVFSETPEREAILSALRSGANGFVSKEADLSVVIEALLTIVEGESYLDPKITSWVLDALALTPMKNQVVALGERELEILSFAARGLSNLQIGRELQISVSTVKAHFRSIFQKLGAASRVQAVILAREYGLMQASLEGE